ncbi:MAG TPA: hypothetical protein DIW36_00165 [Ruminococcaceae bacterium]|nr:hypothetical protein [Oscillospiraceae bacterium]HCT15831.1 hypothetical protein [Oscillospiraceae bacterium]
MPREKAQGVSRYTYGTATVRIAFANGAVCCKNCEYLLNDRGLGRALCKLQHNKVIPIDFTDGIDCECPIIFEEEL